MERQYRGDVRHGMSGEGECPLSNDFQWFLGIDWGSEKHRVCLMDRDGKILEQKWIEHSGGALADLADWLRRHSMNAPGDLAVAIETPRGAVVETLMEHGFAVFSINPKQLDRFRDRYSPAGAKDDERDALVLADSLRTDRHCFHAVRIDDPEIIRLRELSRLEDDLTEEQGRLANQLWAQLHRFFPVLLQLSSSANEPWVWDLFEKAPTPVQAAKLATGQIARILQQHQIRRLDAAKVRDILASKPLSLAPGAAEAASEHALLLLPRLRLLHQQRVDVARRAQNLLQSLAAPDGETEPHEHRDAAVLLSMPGVGRKVAATMLSEAAQAIAERDYHALRCYAGSAPITRRSGKKEIVVMRYSCNERLRNALYYWSLSSIAYDRKARQVYTEMRARGQTHARALRGLADRQLAVMISMLRHNTLYDPQRRAA
jgi:transposase